MFGFGSPKSQPAERAEQDDLRLLWKLSGVGFQLLAEILAGIGIGWLIDRLAGTAPRWITIGAIAGVIVGLTNFVRQALKLNKRLGPPPRLPAKRDVSIPAEDLPDAPDTRSGELAGWLGSGQEAAKDVDDDLFTRTLEEELRRARQELENEDNPSQDAPANGR